ncbi:MAG TPA: hypothetical protein DCG19_07030 [Cryomorphaceae bacterium]|nr:hypothetical protein [Owenweeksia sp.]MBF99848.1 hypothetical protein [Owenweeksia sp.]HAD97143.1 hypothetical protein [Cryomorphaceae bacterium]HBF20863.1 hypothetical protein [Cryomorphaceae bacterium]HCQ17307.1 hypothetical protein [Cryomorphaceae bacterium]|tara:strand:+ start:2299 stop:3027 length:729 start_codon:yes stop_codon:yes gene_type:complete
MKHLIQCALLLILSSKVAFAQIDSTRTTVSFFISPTPQTFMVGDSLLVTGNKMKLEPGTYPIKAWIPTYELIDTSLTVKTGAKPFKFMLRAEKRSPAYLEYLAKSSEYQTQKTLNFTLPVIATSILAGTATYTYFKAQSQYEDANKALKLYRNENRPDKLDEGYTEFDNTREAYRQNIISFYSQVGALAISSYFLYRGIKWLRQNKAPQYKEEKNPLALTSMSASPTIGNTNGLVLGLTFSF